MNKSVRWPDAHVKLRKLYDEHIEEERRQLHEARKKRPDDEKLFAQKEMTQADFGKTYGIGTQSMVWQYLGGHRPLNIEVAAKFAKGLRCTINDISPEMARALESDIVPMLGARALRRAIGKMMIAVVPALFTIPPTPAKSASADTVLCIMLNRWLWWLRREAS